jgi:hypothetical protein
MALLAAEALGLGHGDAGHAHFVQRLLHLVQLERLDDGFDLFHVVPVTCPGVGGDPPADPRGKVCPVFLGPQTGVSRIMPRFGHPA